MWFKMVEVMKEGKARVRKRAPAPAVEESLWMMK
jgi:hypothetical protein